MNHDEVRIQLPVFEQVEKIKDYIENVLLNPSAADKRAKEIISDLKQLRTFPERGFDADEKIGAVIVSENKTFGIPLVDGKYIALYLIDRPNKVVTVFDLLATQSDYAKLFL